MQWNIPDPANQEWMKAPQIFNAIHTKSVYLFHKKVPESGTFKLGYYTNL